MSSCQTEKDARYILAGEGADIPNLAMTFIGFANLTQLIAGLANVPGLRLHFAWACSCECLAQFNRSPPQPFPGSLLSVAAFSSLAFPGLLSAVKMSMTMETQVLIMSRCLEKTECT